LTQRRQGFRHAFSAQAKGALERSGIGNHVAFQYLAFVSRLVVIGSVSKPSRSGDGFFVFPSFRIARIIPQMHWKVRFQFLRVFPKPLVKPLSVVEIQAPNFSSLWKWNASFSCGVEKLFKRACADVV